MSLPIRTEKSPSDFASEGQWMSRVLKSPMTATQPATARDLPDREGNLNATRILEEGRPFAFHPLADPVGKGRLLPKDGKAFGFSNRWDPGSGPTHRKRTADPLAAFRTKTTIHHPIGLEIPQDPGVPDLPQVLPEDGAIHRRDREAADADEASFHPIDRSYWLGR